MLNRRNFMLASGAGFASYGLPCWGTEQPTFLSCGKNSHGRFVVCGISHRGKIIFETVLPSRGHEAVFHPKVPMAVIFGRRPGYFATVIDILKGEVIAILEPQRERHFFGHGTFSSDGKTLYTTENDYVSGRGIIGVWSVFPFKRRSEFFSGGVGPHDITLIDEGDTLVVANGGLRTHPKTGRQVLNSDNFISNLSYFTTNGECLEIVSLAEKFVSLSIRHLSAGSDNSIAFAMQDQ